MKTKLDHIYGSVGGNTTQLENQVNALNTKVTNLSNIAAKTNLNNTFTANQIFNGGFEIGQGRTTTFATNIEMGVGGGIVNMTSEDASNKQIRFSGVPNKGRLDLNMNNVSKIINLPAPTNAKDAVTKEYVDGKSGGWVNLIDWTGNFKTQALEWTKTLTTGNMRFLVNLTYQNVRYSFSFIISVPNATHKWTSPIALFPYGQTQDATTIINSVTNGFFLHYDGTKIKVIKIGQNQPETSTTLNIGYWKVN